MNLKPLLAASMLTVSFLTLKAQNAAKIPVRDFEHKKQLTVKADPAIAAYFSRIKANGIFMSDMNHTAVYFDSYLTQLDSLQDKNCIIEFSYPAKTRADRMNLKRSDIHAISLASNKVGTDGILPQIAFTRNKKGSEITITDAKKREILFRNNLDPAGSQQLMDYLLQSGIDIIDGKIDLKQVITTIKNDYR